MIGFDIVVWGQIKITDSALPTSVVIWLVSSKEIADQEILALCHLAIGEGWV